MKNVLLIGDSIRAGYDKSVRKTLGDRANVIFSDNSGRFAAYVLRYFHEFLEGHNGENIDVIHWNAGLWDTLHMFGEEAFTNQVLSVLTEALGIDEKLEYRKEMYVGKPVGI